MACDIHTRAEVRQAGVWRMAGRVWPARWEDDGRTDEPYSSRCYEAFSILAEVRQGERGIRPIAPPRGLPDDVSAEVKLFSDGWDSDGHNHSWHSLRHLLEYPHWQASYTVEGFVNGEDFRRILAGGRPAQWWYRGARLEGAVSERRMRELLAVGHDTSLTYTLMKWSVLYRDAATVLVTEAIPRLVALASPEPCVLSWAEQAIAGDKSALVPLHDWLEEHGRPGMDDVRMVFFFDN